MAYTINTSTGIETMAVKAPQTVDTSLSKEVQQTAEQLSEYVILGAETEGAKKVFEVVSHTGTGTSSTTHNRRHLLQIQIERVQHMSPEQLQQGIAKELTLEIKKLQKEAQKIEHSFSHFSACALNTILAQIRKIKEQIASLIQTAVEILRELYITLVLKLRLVRA
jgi:hypothetical protein